MPKRALGVLLIFLFSFQAQCLNHRSRLCLIFSLIPVESTYGEIGVETSWWGGHLGSNLNPTLQLLCVLDLITFPLWVLILLNIKMRRLSKTPTIPDTL